MRYKHYMNFSENELHNLLGERRMTDAEREHIKRIVADQKAQLRSEKGKRAQLKLYWSQLTQPLMIERKIIRSMLNYKSTDNEDPRVMALRAYSMVLDKLKSDFSLYQNQKKILPSDVKPNAIHWADWVPQKIKDRIYAMFADIPRKAKTKHKEPFVRTIPEDLFILLKDRLMRRTESELQSAEAQQAIDPTDERAKTIEGMKKAIIALATIEPNTPIPYTWRGLETE